MVALLLLVAGCGNRRAVTLNGSLTPDQAPTIADLAPLADQSQPTPDQALPPTDLAPPTGDGPFQVAEEHGVVTNTDLTYSVPCTPLTFPKDCSKVSMFQCGFGLSCKADGKTLEAKWHHHNWGPGCTEVISMHVCTYVCPKGCVSSLNTISPSNGPDLVNKACKQ